MDPSQIDGPILIATTVVISILIGSALLWIRDVQRSQNVISQDTGIHAWPIGWVNFLIFICAMVIAVFVAQSIGRELLIDSSSDEPPVLTPWLAVAAVLLLQLPMLFVFYAARRFYPGYYADRLSQVELSFSRSSKVAFRLFIMFMPIIWISTLVWSLILEQLKKAGLVGDVAPQQLITLFQQGGALPAIILLVAMAVILAPIVEEIIFRGCIYRFFKSTMTIYAAQFISGVIFALMHGNLLSFVPLVVVGIVLAKVYEKTGSLAVAIWFHAFFNAFSLLMLFITSFSDNVPA